MDYDPAKKDPYLFQYKLKNPEALLWLVLIDENGESKKKISPEQHRYVFRNESKVIPEECEKGIEDHFGNETKVVNITNYFNKEVTMARSVRWAAHESGGLKSLRRSDEGRCIQRRG